MIKVFYGIQKEIIDSKIEEFINKQKIETVLKIDYKESNIDELLCELQYNDLFNTSKLTILYNALFLSSKETLDNKEFNNYLSNPNPNNHLFFVVEGLDERKKIVKLLRKNHEVLEYNKFTTYDALKYVKETFKNDGYKIEDSAVNKMVEYLNTHFGLYKNEIKKLELYKYEEKKILLEDIKSLTSRVPEDDIFKLWNALISNDKEKIFDIYKDIKYQGVDEGLILSLLASQNRFMYQVTILMNDKKSKQEIIFHLKSHPYKTEEAMKKYGVMKEEKILNMLYELSILDIEIKSGQKDKTNALENFFLNI